MRLVHLAIALCLVTACAKKQQAAAPAKPTPSNTEPTAAPAAEPTAAPDSKADGASRSPVKKGGDPCEGGQ